MRLLLTVLLVATVACESTKPSTVGGTYTLVSLDGKPVPVTGADSVLVSSQLTLETAGYWNQLTLVQYPGRPASDTLQEAGVWSAVEGNFTFYTFGDTELYFGTRSGTVFTLRSGPSTFVFSK